MSASSNRFTIDAQGDPIEFWTWLVHTLRSDLGGAKKRSVLTQCFQVPPVWGPAKLCCTGCCADGAGLVVASIAVPWGFVPRA